MAKKNTLEVRFVGADADNTLRITGRPVKDSTDWKVRVYYVSGTTKAKGATSVHASREDASAAVDARTKEAIAAGWKLDAKRPAYAYLKDDFSAMPKPGAPAKPAAAPAPVKPAAEKGGKGKK